MDSFPHFNELAPSEASVFRMHISAAKKANPKGAAVDIHKLSDYKGMKMYLTNDGGAGYAVKPSGELTSVFKHPNSGYENVGQRAAEHATLMAGATHLSAFDPLPQAVYNKAGAQTTGKTKWNDDYKPAGWSIKKMGRQDVTYQALGGKTAGGPVAGTETYSDDYDAQMAKAQRIGEQRTAPIQRAMRRLGSFMSGHDGAKG
jgi:hypothetical protein